MFLNIQQNHIFSLNIGYVDPIGVERLSLENYSESRDFYRIVTNHAGIVSDVLTIQLKN